MIPRVLICGMWSVILSTTGKGHIPLKATITALAQVVVFTLDFFPNLPSSLNPQGIPKMEISISSFFIPGSPTLIR